MPTTKTAAPEHPAQVLEAMREHDAFFRQHAEENDKLGLLVPEVYQTLVDHKLQLLYAPRELGGLEASPTEAMEIYEQISYSDPSTGWVAFVIASATGMAAGYLPDSGVERMFSADPSPVAAGVGQPSGKAVKVDGGYVLNGRWSYGSGIQHVDMAHTGGMIVDENGAPQFDANGVPQIAIFHAPKETMTFHGNWDTVGLRGSGSVDYEIHDAFVPDDYLFTLAGAQPARRQDFFSIGPINLNAIGHSSWAVGAGRRILDDLAEYARGKVGQTGTLGAPTIAGSESFWEGYGAAEARFRAARALLFETWRNVEARMESTSEPSTTRETTEIRLALYEVHRAVTAAADFAYRAAGGTSLREGDLQRTWRDIHTGDQHVTVSPGVLQACGRELAGLSGDMVWLIYGLVEPR